MTDIAAQLVDETKLARYLSGRLPGDGPLEVSRHIAGHSNETFFVGRDGQSWVLRRPPLAVYLPTAHDVLREYRVLSALQSSPVRVPRVLLACEDDSVIGAPFYLMEKVEGSVLRDRIPQQLGTVDQRRRIGEELIRSLAELHNVDPATVGLEGFGKPTGYLERQIRRWTGQLELATSITNQSREVPEMFALKEWLQANVPQTQRTVVVHGDYKLDNVIFGPGAPARLAAILDWEMSTLGDPLADLGWLISFWREKGDPPEPFDRGLPQLTTAEGFSTRRELIALYESLTGLEVKHLEWYVVAAIWKLACLLEGSFGRHLLGTTDDPFFAVLEEGVPALARRAQEISEGALEL